MGGSEQRPIVFISHASADLPSTDRTVEIRDALFEVLSSRGWEVYLDRETLRPGDRWRASILYNLARAKAGVVLFNQKALEKSSWVKAEALILCFHKSVDPRFQLIPVMLEKTTLRDAGFAEYEPFELNEIQEHKDSDTGVAPDVVAAKIADRLDPKRAEALASSNWCVRVRTCLCEVKDALALEQAAGKLKLDVETRATVMPPELAQGQLREAIVTMLHHCAPLEAIPAIVEIYRALNDSKRRELEKYVLAKWVPNESVEILLTAARQRARLGLLTIEGIAANVLDQYRNRAKIEIQAPEPPWIFSVSAAVGEAEEAILYHVEQTIRKEMVPRPYYDENGIELPLARAIDEKVLKSEAHVAICMLPPECSRSEVLRRLRAEYPKIIFVAQPARGAALRDLEPRSLKPPLTSDLVNDLSDLSSRLTAALNSVTLD